MMKKLLLCFAFLGLITACSNSYGDNSSGIDLSPEPKITPAETANIDLATSDEKSKINNDDSNSNAKAITAIIPTGWRILDSREPAKAEGDLNQDGIPDIAIVIARTQESIDDARSLLIAFGTKDHTYSLSIIADDVILPIFAGGGFGDPFDGIVIDRGSVVLSDFGGSNEKWYHKYRFRFQDNDWYLIGATMGSNFPIKDATEMGNNEDDYNLLTGDFISRKTNENGEETITKGNRGKKKLVKLSKFNVDEL